VETGHVTDTRMPVMVILIIEIDSSDNSDSIIEIGPSDNSDSIIEIGPSEILMTPSETPIMHLM